MSTTCPYCGVVDGHETFPPCVLVVFQQRLMRVFADLSTVVVSVQLLWQASRALGLNPDASAFEPLEVPKGKSEKT